MKVNRFFYIDFLRAFSILGVIVVHTFYFHLNNDFNRFVWNYFNFVVVAFVFCSGYVLVAKTPAIGNIKTLFSWYKKRILRLLYPFYIYFFIHLVLSILLPQYFTNFGFKFDTSFILKSLTLTGGADLTWLTLLFIELTLVFPYIARITSFPKQILVGVILFAITLFFTIQKFPYDYFKFVMWIPYLLIMLFSIYFYHTDQKKFDSKKYLIVALLSFGLFVELFFNWIILKRPLLFIDNKYPPNLLYLSYSLALTFVVLLIGKFGFIEAILKSPINFISKYSYALFFVHYIILDFIESVLKIHKLLPNTALEFFLIAGISIGIIYLFQLFNNSYIHKLASK